MWGTDTSNRGVFTKDHHVQLRQPTLVGKTAFEQLSLGFACGAGVTRHGRLVNWGWSGNDFAVRTGACCTLSRAFASLS